MGLPLQNASLIEQGSPVFTHLTGVIAAGAIEWTEIDRTFPRSRTWSPLNHVQVLNNSAQEITVYHNSISDDDIIPAYMIRPYSGKPIRVIGIKNNGAVATVAGDIILKMSRK